MNAPLVALLLAAAMPAMPVPAAAKDAAPRKSDPRREVFVEDTATDFVLKSGLETGSSPRIVTFKLTPDRPGPHTVLCFIDGRIWSRQSIELPGQFALNISGMKPGAHRVTLQAIDANGRVGSAKHKVEVN